jgi:hypothetical protein
MAIINRRGGGEGVVTLEQYRIIPQPVQYWRSEPVGSTVLEGVKHVEHALSRKRVSRTEIKGSRRRRRVPAAAGSGHTRPLPVGVEVSSFRREPESLVAVAAVTGDVVMFRGQSASNS